MRRTPTLRELVCLGGLLLCIGMGCTPTSTTAPPKQPPAHDPCANRLHDLAGAVLHHIALRGTLPEDLAALADSPVGGGTPRVCPVSQKPYLYFAEGPLLPGNRRLVLMDPAPSHNGGRWLVTLSASTPPVPYVTWLPEDRARTLLPARP